jgi:hypothetical protein
LISSTDKKRNIDQTDSTNDVTLENTNKKTTQDVIAKISRAELDIINNLEEKMESDEKDFDTSVALSRHDRHRLTMAEDDNMRLKIENEKEAWLIEQSLSFDQKFYQMKRDYCQKEFSQFTVESIWDLQIEHSLNMIHSFLGFSIEKSVLKEDMLPASSWENLPFIVAIGFVQKFINNDLVAQIDLKQQNDDTVVYFRQNFPRIVVDRLLSDRKSRSGQNHIAPRAGEIHLDLDLFDAGFHVKPQNKESFLKVCLVMSVKLLRALKQCKIPNLDVSTPNPHYLEPFQIVLRDESGIVFENTVHLQYNVVCSMVRLGLLDNITSLTGLQYVPLLKSVFLKSPLQYSKIGLPIHFGRRFLQRMPFGSRLMN